MRVVLMEFMSIDGVTQGPGSPDEDTTGGFTRGGWFVPHLDETFLDIVKGWVSDADAYLFGHRTYEAFARDWPNMPDPEDPVAKSLNGLPKYVAANSPITADWNPTTVISGDVLGAVAELRAAPGRELQIHGSARLGWSLLQANLVDELRLVIAPVVVGAGRRLFQATDASIGLELIETTTTPGGLTVQTFTTGTPAEVGVYDPAVHTYPS